MWLMFVEIMLVIVIQTMRWTERKKRIMAKVVIPIFDWLVFTWIREITIDTRWEKKARLMPKGKPEFAEATYF